MDRSFRFGLILLAGIALLGAALVIHTILLERTVWIPALAIAGSILVAWSVFGLRAELITLVSRRRSEIALFTIGAVGVLIALGYLSVRYPFRIDMTEAGLHSLSQQTVNMLRRLERPVHVVFFYDRLMRETVELYQMMDRESDFLTVEFHEPTLNPARARMLNVQFAGTSVLESEDRRMQIHGYSETDLANAILRVSQGSGQLVCFLDGHGEADPFSMESHDHLEGEADHSHGLGAEYVLHERHGMAKARHGLEALNYRVEKISLVQGGDTLAECALLVIAGPRVPLLPSELTKIREYLGAGGHAFFMLEPFVETGLEPIIREYGVILDETIVIDYASHFWSDIASPAVTSYISHPITRELPLTFFPGARSLSPTEERVRGTSVVPLVRTSRNSYGETNPDRAEFDRDEDLPGPLTLMVEATKRLDRAERPDASLVALDSGDAAGEDGGGGSSADRSRIVVVGDSDFATNSYFHVLGNGKLFLNTVNHLAAREDLIGIEPRTYDLPRLNVTNRHMKITFFVSVILLPALLAMVGTAVWWRQR